jgi:hypothetical protein
MIELSASGNLFGVIRTTYEARTIEEAHSRASRIVAKLNNSNTEQQWRIYKIEEITVQPKQ